MQVMQAKLIDTVVPVRGPLEGRVHMLPGGVGAAVGEPHVAAGVPSSEGLRLCSSRAHPRQRRVQDAVHEEHDALAAAGQAVHAQAVPVCGCDLMLLRWIPTLQPHGTRAVRLSDVQHLLHRALMFERGHTATLAGWCSALAERQSSWTFLEVRRPHGTE